MNLQTETKACPVQARATRAAFWARPPTQTAPPGRSRAKGSRTKTTNETRRAITHPSAGAGKFKSVAGSGCDDFNHIVMNQAVRALWLKHSDEATQDQQYQAALSAMMGIAPRDEIEGMLAAQMVTAHNAVMECYRRAMLDEQTFEGYRENLNQANRLSRGYTMLMDALSRHRGKGQQKVTVEHVHVHAGGQAVVGAVETGGGVASKNQRQPHASLTHAPVAPLWSENQEREPVPLAGDAERSLPHARR
jgi:hypothetical protein